MNHERESDFIPGIPWYVHVLAAIGRTKTRGAERAMLLATPHWLNRKTLTLYPSVESWAKLAGCDKSTARRALRSLTAKGILTVAKPSRGGTVRGHAHTTIYQLNVPHHPKSPQDVESEASGAPAHDARADGHPTSPPLASGTHHPLTTPPEPSMHPPSRPSGEPTMAQEARVQGSMDACRTRQPPHRSDIRDRLRRLGVRGPMLERLAQAEDMSLAAIDEEWRALQDQAGVRNPAALLVTRLCDRLGISLHKRPRPRDEDLPAISAIEQRRSQLARKPAFSRVGEGLEALVRDAHSANAGNPP